MSNYNIENNNLNVNSTEVDIFDIRTQILSFIESSEKEDLLIEKILLFLFNLTNARGIVYLLTDKNSIKIKKSIFGKDMPCKKEFFLEHCKNLSKECFQDQKLKIGGIEYNNLNFFILTVPVIRKSDFFFSIALILELDKNEALEPFLIILQIVVGYIPFIGLKNIIKEKDIIAFQSASFVEIITNSIKKKDLKKSCQSLVEQLQNYLNCHRVILGIKKNFKCKLTSISGFIEFDKRGDLTKAFETAMEESLRERKIIRYPLPLKDKYEMQIDIAHQELLKLSDSKMIITSPLIDNDKEIAAITFIWNEEPSKEHLNFIEAVSPHITQLIILLKKVKSIKIFDDAFKMKKIFHFAIFIIIFIGIFFILKSSYMFSIEAPCELQPFTKHSVTVPFEGILENVYCKPGDFIKKNSVMAKLDDRELNLELSSIEESIAAMLKKRDYFFSMEEVVDYQMSALELKKLEIKKQLIKQQIDNIEIKSPKSGIVLQGDLEQAIGMPVKTGQVLFELAPLDKLSLEIFVEDQDISYINKNMKVSFQIGSYVGLKWEVEINYISPISEIKEQRNVYTCESIFDNSEGKIMPGMKGYAKIHVGKKPIWWIIFHKPINWMRYKIWW